jgi:hypothetical protein
MRIGDVTRKHLLAVSCPTCGVAAGKRCLLHGGGLRNEPHIDRKLRAIGAVESRRLTRVSGAAASMKSSSIEVA